MAVKTHDLKSWPEFFAPIFSGAKNFDLRKDNDRHFNVGDILRIREYDDMAGKYTRREVKKVITYITKGIGIGAITPLHGLRQGYSILGFGPVP